MGGMMMMMKIHLLGVLCLVAMVRAQFLFNGTDEVQKKTLVRTRLGDITGFLFVRDQLNITCYLGVPYAQPPVGKLRFAKPQMIKPWRAPLRAVHANRICPQVDFDGFNPKGFDIVRKFGEKDPKTINYYLTEKNEDCLQLSIFTRNLAKPNKTVVVFIHGGAFVTGTSAYPDYDYPMLAALDENTVIVAINYRLNVFGFISTGRDAPKGNIGLYDQILALKWIQMNIQAFGGDPKEVTLWGQSGGSISIALQLMTNASDQLFRRAIMESGSALVPITIADDSYRHEAFDDFLRQTNCVTHQNVTFDCLEKRTTQQIMAAYRLVFKKYPLAFLPNANDTELFGFATFWQGVKHGKFNLDKDILIGTNDNEGAQYSKFGPLEKYYHGDRIDGNFTKANIVETLRKVVAGNRFIQDMVEPAVDILCKDVHNVSDPTEMWTRYNQLVGDMVFGCGDYHFITNYVEQSHSPVYYYRFRPRVSRPVECPRWSTGACHTDELQFVFGIPQLYTKTFAPESFPAAEIELSKRISRTWLQFAHHGHMNTTTTTDGDVYNWQAISKGGDTQYLSIDKPSATMVKGFPAQNCHDIFPMLYDLIDGGEAFNLIKTHIANIK